MTATARSRIPELANELRPALLLLTRLVRQQRVDTTVTLSQLSAMGTLALSGPMTPGELAAQERVQPPSLTKVLASLEERGLVRRTPHPSDRRQAVVSLTDAGRELLETERDSRTAWLSQRLALLTADERAQVARTVPLLQKLAE